MEAIELAATPVLHKPIFYGSELANAAFGGGVWLHVLLALAVPIGAIGALCARKGRVPHLLFGKIFTISLLGLVLSGVLIDIIRLTIYVEANHTKYAGFSMPSTYPARFAFLYASICTVVLLLEAIPSKVAPWRQLRASVLRHRSWPLLLSAGGIAITVLVVARFNPWSGALWLVWTFAVAMLLSWLARFGIERGWFVATLHHRLNMLVLASFAGWGLYQGFYPGMRILEHGASMTTEPYVGHLPGEYSYQFIRFLRQLAPFFAVGIVLFVAYSWPVSQRVLRRSASDDQPK